MTEPMSQYPKTSKNQQKPKKTKRQHLCPSIWHRANTFDFFVFSRQNQKSQKGRTYVPISGIGPILLIFFWFFEAKPKKPKRQNLCPSIWHGVNTFVFFGFSRQKQKKQKNKMAEPMSQYLVWGQYFCFFCFFFFEAKPKKTKNQIWQNLCPVSGMGPVLLFFLVFRGFCNILVSDMGSAILFCLYFFRGFCNFLVSDMGSAILLFWFFKVFAIFGLS